VSDLAHGIAGQEARLGRYTNAIAEAMRLPTAGTKALQCVDTCSRRLSTPQWLSHAMPKNREIASAGTTKADRFDSPQEREMLNRNEEERSAKRFVTYLSHGTSSSLEIWLRGP
jgi:hypothetical protein